MFFLNVFQCNVDLGGVACVLNETQVSVAFTFISFHCGVNRWGAAGTSNPTPAAEQLVNQPDTANGDKPELLPLKKTALDGLLGRTFPEPAAAQ